DVHRAGPVTDGFRIARMRSSLIEIMAERATPDSISSLKRVQLGVPSLELARTIEYSEVEYLKRHWSPPSPRDFLELIANDERRLVRSGRHLQEIVIEALFGLQQRLHGELPARRDLWDRQQDGWTPVNEEELSDYVARHLISE